MIRDIYLHGAAGREYGRHFRLDVVSPAEALRALMSLRPGIERFMRERSWRVIVGKPHLKNAIEADSLNMNAGNQSLHFVPTVAVAGGQSRSAGKIIVGVILIGAALVLAPMTGGFSAGMAAYAIGGSTMGLTFGNIVMLGASMILAGASALMTQGPNDGASPEDKARPDDRPSFIFNGIVNNTQQGSPVPLVYGEHLVGSIVVNASINSEDIYL